jgi:hypothetical protein
MKIIDQPISNEELREALGEYTLVVNYLPNYTGYVIGAHKRVVMNKDLIDMPCPNVYLRQILSGLFNEAFVPQLNVIESPILASEIEKVRGDNDLHISYAVDGVQYSIGTAVRWASYGASHKCVRVLINEVLEEVSSNESY